VQQVQQVQQTSEPVTKTITFTHPFLAKFGRKML
jgi:hypothetical protein